MRCGKCHNENVTIDHVRACYQVGVFQPLTTVHGDGRDGQYQLLQRLLAERDMTPLGPYDEVSKTISKQAATEMISDLINNHKRQKRNDTAPAVPAGYYAIKSLTGNNDFDFLEVDKPTDGDWAGWVFVKRVIGGRASSNIHRSEVNKTLKAIIEMGIEESGMLFARELRHCRFCNRHLTKYASRALSCGPNCAEQRGFGGLWYQIQKQWEEKFGKDADVPEDVEQIRLPVAS